ncbi:MAG: cation-translocating P-type ATPase [Bdellovibrionales bacterium]|nr:cation-translocating P-type ATPase [Bdellovibrionales bacterium]
MKSDQARALLEKDGYNELPKAKKKSFLLLIWEVLREPMILLLLTGAGIYLAIGEIHDSLLLLASVLVIVFIAIFQERRSTRAVEALRDLSSPRARVWRDQREIQIPSREVVPGDTLIVKEGERIVADCLLLESRSLEVDESLLTGESVPISKSVSSDGSRLQFPSAFCIYSGTLVTRGFATGKVIATGLHSELGKIGKTMQEAKDTKTRLQEEIAGLVRIFGTLGVITSIVITLAFGFTRHDWLQALLAGIVAALSLLPEEFPVVLTIFLALGAWRLSKKQVLVRQPSATENLGSITALCTDKTGTLTLNQMSVEQIWTEHSQYHFHKNVEPLSAEIFSVLEAGFLASYENSFDPMEKALQKTFKTESEKVKYELPKRSLEKDYPLSPDQLTMSFVWRSPINQSRVVFSKGAPEAIVNLCNLETRLQSVVLEQVFKMCEQGLRVIGVAKASLSGSDFPKEQKGFQFSFLGLIGFIDPLREGVKEAITECYQAGIRTIMITGDHPAIASKIAGDIGLKDSGSFLTGEDIEKLTDNDLRDRIKYVNVFARVVPNQKLRIVKALKANGETVAMTGDGVNDAPSLKWADVGVAMGGRGTDVAREAADLIILDDQFNSIVAGIRLGRRIFDNIQRAMSYLFAVHFPIAALAILPVLIGGPLILFPIHIVFLELIIDPACTLVFEAEPESAKTMKVPPRKLEKPLFSFQDIALSLLQGMVVFAGIFMLFLWGLHQGWGEAQARAMAFSAFVLSNVGLIFVNKTSKHVFSNLFFVVISFAALVLLMAILFIESLSKIFKLETIDLTSLGISALVAVFCVFIASKIKNLKIR